MAHVPDDAAVTAVAALNDPVRHALFDTVRRAPAAVTRAEAATAVGISRKLAAFHLDKLVDVGLLVLDRGVDATTPSPGRVGRRPKRYRSAEQGLQVSIPPRRTLLLSQLLLEGLARLTPPADDVLPQLWGASREQGRVVGEAEEVPRSGRMGAERALGLLRSLLERLGYDPMRAGTGPVQFRSCPFFPLAAEAPDVVCGIHHAYVSGIVEGLGLTSVEAALVPGSGACCVELRPRAR